MSSSACKLTRRPRSAWRWSERRTETEQIARSRSQAAAGGQAASLIRLAHRHEAGNRAAVNRDLERLPALDFHEKLTGALPQLAHAYAFHVLHSSTIKGHLTVLKSCRTSCPSVTVTFAAAVTSCSRNAVRLVSAGSMSVTAATR